MLISIILSAIVLTLCCLAFVWQMRALSAPQAPAYAPINPSDLVADYAPPGGWYAWEAAQYRATGAPWFDPHRYDGTWLEEPAPTLQDHIANYKQAEQDAFRVFGKSTVDKATWWVVSRCPPEWREAHMKEIDPIGWCVQRWFAAGKPEVSVPLDWSRKI